MFLPTNILTQSLWRDEAFSALMARHNPLDIIRLSAGDANPPLFSLLLRYWTLLFGSSEIAMRSLTILFLVATAASMYLIGKTFSKHSGRVFGRSIGAGWWLAALTLTQPLLFYYGFEIRAYSLMVLLTALTIYFYLRSWRWPLFISGTALLYTHLFGWWLILILGLWSINRRKNILPLAAAGLVGLLWVPNYINFARVGGGFLSPPNAGDLVSTVIALGLPILLLTLPYLSRLWKTEPFRFFLSLWAVPILGTFIASQVKPEFLDRYLILTVPAELLLVGLTVGRRLAAYLLGLAVLVQAILCWSVFTNPQKEPFRELATYVKAELQPGDVVVNASSLTYFESQYYGLSAPIYSPDRNVPYYVGRVLIPDSAVVTRLPAAKRIWLVELEEGGGTLGTPLPLHQDKVSNFGRLKLTLYEI